jgi:hypothetical protein
MVPCNNISRAVRMNYQQMFSHMEARCKHLENGSYFTKGVI